MGDDRSPAYCCFSLVFQVDFSDLYERISPRCSGVGVIPNRRLKSATRWHPAIGGFGEIPEPTVKVRMRGTRKG